MAKRQRLKKPLRLKSPAQAPARKKADSGAPLDVQMPQVRLPNAVYSLTPQPGPQTAFAQTLADIAIFGGSAGGGKSFALLLEPLRAVRNNPNYAAVIFRRTTPSIRNPGALWDESMKVYGILPERPSEAKTVLEWDWAGCEPKGGKVKFAHLEHETTVLDWHGAQVPLIGFDELCEFTQKQFFYLLSRNRSTCGVRPYVRATCNPDADSWVAEFIAWWIDQTTGFPIPERAGKLRWFVRVGDDLRWGDTPGDLTPEKLGVARFGADGKEIDLMPKSVTFIPATVYDNVELMKADPMYLANLLALPTVERERLLKGNWKIKPAAGLHFRREWVEVIEHHQLPKGLIWKRGWDLAATKKTQLNDPDWTTGTKLGKDPSGKDPFTYVADHKYVQESSGEVEILLEKTAAEDGMETEQWLPQDPGQAGKSQAKHLTRLLSNNTVRTTPETGDKLVRFGPFSSQAQAGFVKVVRGPWNDRWFSQLEGYPELPHDDDLDSTSRAYNAFIDDTSGLLEYCRAQAEKMAKEAQNEFAPAKPAALGDGGVLFEGPEGVNVLYDLKGFPIFGDEQRRFVVNQEHAKMLRRNPNSGFKEVKLF